MEFSSYENIEIFIKTQRFKGNKYDYKNIKQSSPGINISVDENIDEI